MAVRERWLRTLGSADGLVVVIARLGESPAMSDYRLYFLNEDGHFAHVVALDCRDDQHAIETVEEHRDGREMELWLNARMVKRFKAKEDA